MPERRTWSTKYDPEIIPLLAQKRARAYSTSGLTVGRYLEMLVLRDAGWKQSLGEPVADEGATLARIGSLLAFADAVLPADPAKAAEYLAIARRAILERSTEIQETVALTQRLRSHEAWLDAGGVIFEGYPGRLADNGIEPS